MIIDYVYTNSDLFPMAKLVSFVCASISRKDISHFLDDRLK